MDYNNIYSLSDKDLRGAINLLPCNKMDYYKLFRGEVDDIGSVLFQINYGDKRYDIVNTGYAGLYLFSDKVISLLSENEINGWGTYPCQIKGTNLKGYSVFTVTGRCNEIDYSKSERFMKQPYSPNGKAIEALKGLYFDIDTWDKSDIFTPTNSVFTFITEKVNILFRKNKITNLKLEQITEVEII